MVLGRNTEEAPMPILMISQAENIPKKFLEQILLELRNAGILFSIKGAKGGYGLNKPISEIFLTQIIRLIDGPIALQPCVSLNFYRKCDECISEEICGIRDTFIDVRDAMLEIFNKTSIADLLQREADDLKRLEQKRQNH